MRSSLFTGSEGFVRSCLCGNEISVSDMSNSQLMNFSFILYIFGREYIENTEGPFQIHVTLGDVKLEVYSGFEIQWRISSYIVAWHSR